MSTSVPPIVIDTGASMCRAGFAGEDAPTVIFPTVVGRSPSDESAEPLVGEEAIKNDLDVSYPFEKGVVRSWDDLSQVWRTAFKKLDANPEEHAIMLPDIRPKAAGHRQKIAQIMFEEFKVPSLCIQDASILNLLAGGRVSSISVDMGHEQTTIKAVYEGYLVPDSVCKLSYGGKHITDYLKTLLESRGKKFESVEDLSALQRMKEELCFASKDYEADLARTDELNETFTFPDGSSIVLGQERFQCVEALFKNDLIDKDEKGIHNYIHQSINGCDISCRGDIACNIIISGGCSLITSFKERLQAELKSLFPERLRVQVVAIPERGSLAWIGASVHSSLEYFPQYCVTKQEYEEQGVQVIQKFL